MFLMALFQAKSRISACSWLLLFRCVIASSLIYSSWGSDPRLVFSLYIQAEFGLRLLCVAIKKAVQTWLQLIPELKFHLFCCLWNSLGCLDVSGQVFPILNLFVWKRAQMRELSLSQALVVLFQRLKFWLERTDFWEIKAQSPSPSLSAGILWQRLRLGAGLVLQGIPHASVGVECVFQLHSAT